MSNSQFFTSASEEKKKSEEWKTIYKDNQGKLLIGVYDFKNDQIFLRPAMPGRLYVVYKDDVDWHVVKGQKLGEDNKIIEDLSQADIDELNKKYKDALPRYYTFSSCSVPDLKVVARTCLLARIGQEEKGEYFRGFSVISSIPPSKDNFTWISGSLNKGSRFVIPDLQEKIFNQFESVFGSKKKAEPW